MPRVAGTKRSTEVDVEVGRRIRMQRINLGMSQTHLADAIGVTFQQVQKYEKGANRVGAGRLSQIASALDIPVASFFLEAPKQRVRGTDRSAADLLSRPHVLDLLKAFSQLESGPLRLSVVKLVQALSEKA